MRSIGIARDINAIVVDVNGNLISASVHMEAFSEKTINPLKRDLKQLLKENKDKQKIINSIISCILSNTGRIKASQMQYESAPNNNGHNNHKRSEGGNNAKDLVEMASLKENTEQFFKDQYGRPHVGVRLRKNKILTIMPLKSSKCITFPSCLEGRRDYGRIVSARALHGARKRTRPNSIQYQVLSLTGWPFHLLWPTSISSWTHPLSRYLKTRLNEEDR